jgi:hypothetical protein
MTGPVVGLQTLSAGFSSPAVPPMRLARGWERASAETRMSDKPQSVSLARRTRPEIETPRQAVPPELGNAREASGPLSPQHPRFKAPSPVAAQHLTPEQRCRYCRQSGGCPKPEYCMLYPRRGAPTPHPASGPESRSGAPDTPGEYPGMGLALETPGRPLHAAPAACGREG